MALGVLGTVLHLVSTTQPPANFGPTAKGMNSVFGVGLYNSWFWVDHTAGVGGMFATQVLPYFHPPAYDLFCQFETAAYDHLAA